MSARRLVALDATGDDGRVRAALARALSPRPERVYLFRDAARVAAGEIKGAQAAHDRHFIDQAARYLLEDRPAPAPARTSGSPLTDVCLAIGGGDGFIGLPQRACEVELLGSFVCMAVPTRDDVLADEIDNAHVWVVGGALEASIEMRGTRSIVVSPGDLCAGGAIACIELNGPAPLVMLMSVDGTVLETRLLDASKSTRMSVRG